jgi:hypothetical protein
MAACPRLRCAAAAISRSRTVLQQAASADASSRKRRARTPTQRLYSSSATHPALHAKILYIAAGWARMATGARPRSRIGLGPRLRCGPPAGRRWRPLAERPRGSIAARAPAASGSVDAGLPEPSPPTSKTNLPIAPSFFSTLKRSSDLNAQLSAQLRPRPAPALPANLSSCTGAALPPPALQQPKRAPLPAPLPAPASPTATTHHSQK